MPRSPWTASAGCRNTADVPVLHRVATILRAMWPLLPIPVTITLPGCARIKSTARIRSPFRRVAAERMESASISMAARAAASHSLSGAGGIGLFETAGASFGGGKERADSQVCLLLHFGDVSVRRL